ncbi:hypothetical protein HA402_008309 [Bradysia odoriphaga]|nr:hypothetical protein HA402_008309 [Bradysia odoriphaga]
MEAANVETDLESVPFTDKESDKISDTVRLDDDVEAPKTDVEESFEFINNGDIGDTNKSDVKNVTDEFNVSTSKDIISLDSNVSLETSDQIVENSVSNIEETDQGLSVDNDPEQLLTEVSADDENLLDEIHSGSFNATSSPLGKSSSNLNRSVQSIEDSYEMLENETLEEEHEEDIEEEEEKDRTNDDHNDTIVLDDDDDDEDDVNDDSEDEDDHFENSDNDDDESLDGSDKDENHDYDHRDDDISTLSSDGDIEMIRKVPDRKPKIVARKKVVPVHRRLIKKSIKILTSSKPKRTMHLKSSSAITVTTEHPNGNTETISTEKTKEAEKMVQMFSNESVEDDDDVCLIEDSPVKVNGKHETEDIESVEQKIKIEQMEIEDNIESEIVDKQEDVETLKTEDNVEVNGVEDDLSSNKLQPPTTTESIVIVAEPVATTTDSSSKEATLPTVPITVETPAETVSNTKPNHKRSRSTSPTDDVQPTKRLKTELEQNFIGHNKRVQDYIDKTSNNSIDEINNHVVGLLAEVQELHAMAAAKEQEWNNILYLKSVKEEIICRLTRRKSVMEISSSKVGEVEDYTILEQQPSISQKITKENRNSTSINHSANVSHSQNAYLRNLSTTEAAKLINNRADMSTSDLDEERVIAAKMHSILFSRNILPKPELAGRSSPTINHLTSLTSANMQQIQQQQQQKAQQQFIEQQQQIYQQHTEHLNGHHQVGRQGAIKDVKSIIEAFRQKNPERAPRRGRRLKGNSDGTVMSPRSTDGILSRQSVEGRVSELGLLLAKDISSRPSSADSSPGNSNLASTNNNISTANANIAFNDMLMQYAKLNERPADLLTNATMMRQQQQSGYPEVTLHPVSSQQNTVLHQSDSLQSNSLLHGILTKQNTRPSTTYNSFSPTLARLLTAPERITALPNNYRLPSSTPVQSKTGGMNLTKPRNEITITPVMSNPAMHQTILQQQLQRQQDSAARMKFPLIDDEADDSADRLVIDEGDVHNEQSATAGGREFPENEFPKCQGCKKHEAQFVCAGCENQWYCSRICQVSAWDEHCEMCSG